MDFDIDTILFDFDGTLVEINIDFTEMKRRILSLGIAEYGIIPKTDLYVLELVENMYNILSEKDVAKAEMFKKQAEEIIVNIELSAAENSRMFPNADVTLKEIKNRGIKIGIVTRNCRKAVLKSSESAGFVYDLLLTRDDVKKVKPDPSHLLSALVLLNSRPEKAIMIGDQPIDIIAGKKAGMKTAAVLNVRPIKDFEELSPDLILEDISDILEIFQN